MTAGKVNGAVAVFVAMAGLVILICLRPEHCVELRYFAGGAASMCALVLMLNAIIGILIAEKQ